MTEARRLPYPGLRSFTAAEADLFFGREGCVDAMVDRLAASRMLTVLGLSGSGKSSLVRTGLIEALESGFHAKAGSRWRIADMHPGGQVMRNLAQALLATRPGKTAEPNEVELLVSFLRRGPRGIVEWARDGNLDPGWNLLILVDQFEELFRYLDYAGREEVEAFVGLLLESASTPDAPIHVVLTMRSEYLGACALLPGLAERVNKGVYLIPRMGRDECREAIEGPAGVERFAVQPALVARMLNDLAQFAPFEGQDGTSLAAALSRRADQLPLMQHVLNRLWQRAIASGAERPELKLVDYDSAGGLAGSLNAHGEELLATLGLELLPQVETVFRALVSGETLATAVRRPARLHELMALTHGARADVARIVQVFSAADCNFLTVSDRTLTDATMVEIGHESLIRQWSRLSGWLEKEAASVSTWGQLQAATRRHAEGRGELLAGLDLSVNRVWWDTEKPTPVWVEWVARDGSGFDAVQAFLQTSQKTEEARLNELIERTAADEAAAAAEAQRRAATWQRRLTLAGVGFGIALSVVAATIAGGVLYFNATGSWPSPGGGLLKPKTAAISPVIGAVTTPSPGAAFSVLLQLAPSKSGDPCGAPVAPAKDATTLELAGLAWIQPAAQTGGDFSTDQLFQEFGQLKAAQVCGLFGAGAREFVLTQVGDGLLILGHQHAVLVRHGPQLTDVSGWPYAQLPRGFTLDEAQHLLTVSDANHHAQVYLIPPAAPSPAAAPPAAKPPAGAPAPTKK